MPELPEVETIRRIVATKLTGRRLASYELRLPKLLRDSPIPSLDPLMGRAITGATRRAKVLVIGFEQDLSAMVHFKLAGQLVVIAPHGDYSWAGHPIPHPMGPLPHKTTHLTLSFDDGTIAHYSDIRQFGWWRIMPTADVEPVLAGFGFGPEGTGRGALDPAELRARLGRKGIPIKVALLDQTVVAGLGNIYVDEALFAARVHPARPASSVDATELDALVGTIPWALDRGIEQGGATIVHGRAYPEDGFPQVHAREGEPCVSCGTPIVKTRVGGRGTYYCPDCQPDPPDWVRVSGKVSKRMAGSAAAADE